MELLKCLSRHQVFSHLLSVQGHTRICGFLLVSFSQRLVEIGTLLDCGGSTGGARGVPGSAPMMGRHIYQAPDIALQGPGLPDYGHSPRPGRSPTWSLVGTSFVCRYALTKSLRGREENVSGAPESPTRKTSLQTYPQSPSQKPSIR